MPVAGTCAECGGRTYKGRLMCTRCETAAARKPRPPLQPCGTTGGYRRHWKAGEKPCDPCLNAEADRAYRKLHPEWDGSERSRRPRIRYGRRGGTKTFTCEQCGIEFRRYSHVGNTKTGVPRFCSRKCDVAARTTGRSRIHARRRKAVVASTWDGVTDEQIWERDGWACKIPGCELGPIRRDLKWPERLSPTVDHIVPLSRGGTDIARNKRAAHATCNSSRNNRMHPDDVQIITPELAPLGLLPVRLRIKAVNLCADCNTAPVKREGACCAPCFRAARATRSEEMQQQALSMRERGMRWQRIADELGLSGPGAAYNVAHPPWDRYTA